MRQGEQTKPKESTETKQRRWEEGEEEERDMRKAKERRGRDETREEGIEKEIYGEKEEKGRR